ncbi:hypothetical protein N0V82_007271 [Gnomoniopsis sp. IMI 355080]|nr:hypothetical protein N0V82_007271 [Gnomoniopsis sp. IMI 355080]
MRDSASYIREELEELRGLLTTMKNRERARRELENSGPKVSDENPSARLLPSEPRTVESSPAQPFQVEEAFAEPVSYTYTTESIQIFGEREDDILERRAPPQHPPECPNIFPDILDSIEEEDLLLESVAETNVTAPSSADDEEEVQQQTLLLVQSSPSQENDPPQNSLRADVEEEVDLQTPRSVQPTSFEDKHLMETIVGAVLNEEDHQRTPRSLRPPNPVQKRFPFASEGEPASRRLRTTHRQVSNRASLKPVIGQRKVSQMTQFWSQKMATDLNV